MTSRLQVPITQANSPSTTLSSNITASATTIPVTNAANLPSLAAGRILYLNIGSILVFNPSTGYSGGFDATTETIQVTQINANSLTVVRAIAGTAQAWQTGAIIACNINPQHIENVVNNIGILFDEKPDIGILRKGVINPSFQVWQRGTTFTSSNVSGFIYTVDRWMFGAQEMGVANRATGVFAQEASIIPSDQNYSAKISLNNSAGNTNAIIVKQRIEQVNMKNYAGKNITFAILVRRSSTDASSLTISMNSPTAVDNYTSIAYSDAIPVTISDFTTVSNSAFVLYTGSAACPANSSNNGLELTITYSKTGGGYFTTNETKFYIGRVYFFAGENVLPFMPISYAEELGLCQRYFQRFNTNAVDGFTMFATGFTYDANNGTALLYLPMKMRSVPTFTQIGLFDIYQAATVQVTLELSGRSKPSVVRLNFSTTGSPWVAGHTSFLEGYNDMTADIFLSAEL